MRRALLFVVAGTEVAIAAELASERHWDGPVQLIPWGALAALTVGLVLAFRSASAGAAPFIALGVALTSLVGVYEHVMENLSAGPLDQKFAYTWDSMSSLRHVWLAVSGGVGPAPPLAAASLAQAALLLLVATWPLGAAARRAA